MVLNSGVYSIRNLRNDKIYVGSTTDFTRRLKKHFQALRRGNHINAHLQAAYNLYGEKVFECEVLERCRPEDIFEVEQRYLDELDRDQCYNMAFQAGGGGHEETERELALIDIDGTFVDLFRSGSAAARFLGLVSVTYALVNTPKVYKRSYYLVTPDYLHKHYDDILLWHEEKI